MKISLLRIRYEFSHFIQEDFSLRHLSVIFFYFWCYCRRKSGYCVFNGKQRLSFSGLCVPCGCRQPDRQCAQGDEGTGHGSIGVVWSELMRGGPSVCHRIAGHVGRCGQWLQSSASSKVRPSAWKQTLLPVVKFYFIQSKCSFQFLASCSFNLDHWKTTVVRNRWNKNTCYSFRSIFWTEWKSILLGNEKYSFC